MSTNANLPDVADLFNSAASLGNLSGQSMQAFNIPDIGAQIQAALGTSADNVQATEVFLDTELVDDSGSIRDNGNENHVRNGVNLVTDALKESKQDDSILKHIRYLNGTILCPYTPLGQVPKLDSVNYRAIGGTPLYDMTVVTLGTVVAKAQEFADNGVPVRTATLIVTDGYDQHSRRNNPSDVKAIVEDMLKTEMHIIAAMGIDDGKTDFWAVFTGWTRGEIQTAKADGTFDSLQAKGGMGLIPRWVLTPGNTPHEIRIAFQAYSRSSKQASQNAGSFSKTALGGFGAVKP